MLCYNSGNFRLTEQLSGVEPCTRRRARRFPPSAAHEKSGAADPGFRTSRQALRHVDEWVQILSAFVVLTEFVLAREFVGKESQKIGPCARRCEICPRVDRNSRPSADAYQSLNAGCRKLTARDRAECATRNTILHTSGGACIVSTQRTFS